MKDQQFYSTSAQVIPVFVLALAFEFRLFERRAQTVGHGLFVVSLLVALAGGELLALLALLTDDAQRFTKPMVGMALVWGVIGLFTPLLLPTLRGLAQSLPGGVVRAIRVGWPIVFLAVLGVGIVTGSDAVIPGAIFVLWLLLACVAVAVMSVDEGRAIKAQSRETAGPAEGDVSRTVSRTGADPAQPSATERN